MIEDRWKPSSPHAPSQEMATPVANRRLSGVKPRADREVWHSLVQAVPGAGVSMIPVPRTATVRPPVLTGVGAVPRTPLRPGAAAPDGSSEGNEDPLLMMQTDAYTESVESGSRASATESASL